MKYKMTWGLVGLAAVTALVSLEATAMCLPTPCYQVDLLVSKCEEVTPESSAQLTRRLERFSEKDRTRILKSYDGLRLTGRVFLLRDSACPHGLGADLKQEPWLKVGDLHEFFVGPKHKLEGCNGFKENDVVSVQVAQACCDGDPNPPCHIGLGDYVFGRSKRASETKVSELQPQTVRSDSSDAPKN